MINNFTLLASRHVIIKSTLKARAKKNGPIALALSCEGREYFTVDFVSQVTLVSCHRIVVCFQGDHGLGY